MSLLDDAQSMMGPLSETCRYRILRFIKEPTAKHWHDIHGIIISPTPPRTVWNAVCAVDPTFPKSTVGVAWGIIERPEVVWPRVPDPFTVARAIRDATRG